MSDYYSSGYYYPHVTGGNSGLPLCPVCGLYGHSLMQCYRVRSIEYYENGNIRRIELFPRGDGYSPSPPEIIRPEGKEVDLT